MPIGVRLAIVMQEKNGFPAMIEPIPLLALPLSGPPRASGQPDEQLAFSFAAAMGALQSQAGAALEAHGAKPAEALAPIDDARRKNPATTPSNASSAASSDNGTATTEPAAGTKTHDGDLAQRRPDAPFAAGVGATLLSAPTGRVTVGAHQAGVAPPPGRETSRMTHNGAMQPSARSGRDAHAPGEALRKSMTKPAPSANATEFAKLVAKKIAERSTFELRLDPPDLGRIEGRLQINRENEAALILKFDNQAAFDLFSRDEAALRSALHDAGLDAEDARLDLVFDEKTEKSSLSELGPHQTLTAGASLSDRQLALDLWT